MASADQDKDYSQRDSPSLETDEASVEITIKFPPEKHTQKWAFSPADTFEHLLLTLSLEFPSYDWSKAKALLEKRQTGLKSIYTPSDDSALPLSTLNNTTLRLLAPQTSALSTLQDQRAAAESWQAKRALARARYGRLPAAQQRHADDINHTFHTLRALPHLPNSARSLAFLERLKADPGIRAAMRKHRFSVGLLTEMDPASATSASHEGVTRILGLNRNRGEVVELRLRTDAYDGWRDYRVIRKTLCHELAHNVHSDHDKHFWALCHQIEREVERADWTHGGQTVGGEDGSAEGLSAREIRARAAEARWSSLEKATRQDGEGGDEGGGREEEG
ncbi:WLM domain-containing protein [Chaetomium sp. MPI-CAGE-AT-0009]|nr:WLM domain-containing protein [Chaetomium sp. MPI-CAGE-AT-0009]